MGAPHQRMSNEHAAPNTFYHVPVKTESLPTTKAENDSLIPSYEISESKSDPPRASKRTKHSPMGNKTCLGKLERYPNADPSDIQSVATSLPATSIAAEKRKTAAGTKQNVRDLRSAVRLALDDDDDDKNNKPPRNAVIGAGFTPLAPVHAATAATATAARDDNNNKDGNLIITTIPPTTTTATAPVTTASRRGKKARAAPNTLYDVICCRCGKILNLQNVHYAFWCVHCRHKRCEGCGMRAI